MLLRKAVAKVETHKNGIQDYYTGTSRGREIPNTKDNKNKIVNGQMRHNKMEGTEIFAGTWKFLSLEGRREQNWAVNMMKSLT